MIEWKPEPEFWSANQAEHALVGAYELVAFDIPPNPADESIKGMIRWEIFTGPKLLDLVTQGDAETFDAAKAAAEAAWRALDG